VGTSLKKETYIGECSDIDDIIAFRKDGKYSIAKVQDKYFFGKDLIHVDVWRKGDERTTYNVVYWDGAAKRAMVKRFNATGLVREREYDVTNGHAQSQVLYFSANSNGEAELVTVHLSAMAGARVKSFEYDFSKLAIKGRGAAGNQLTKYKIKRIDLKEKGGSTLGGVKVWWDEITGRLNGDEKGQYLGDFQDDERIIVFYNEGSYELNNYELTNRFDPAEVYSIQKYHAEQPIQCIYVEGGSKREYVKRFLIETSSLGKRFVFISEEKGSKLMLLSTAQPALVELSTELKKGEVKKETLDLAEFMDVKGWRTQGNRLSQEKVKKAVLKSERVGDWEKVEDEPSVEADEPEPSDPSDNQESAAPAPKPAAAMESKVETPKKEVPMPKESDDGKGQFNLF
jgi:topoisomerase-4 subunit A